ncbi:hypothetical protein GF324_07775 [bacterium]|nr:hypothetical protein [bacterium]
MSGSGKEAIRGFHDTLVLTIRNGSFGASALANEAPEQIQQIAAEQGLDLAPCWKKRARMWKNTGTGMGPHRPRRSGRMQWRDRMHEPLAGFVTRDMESCTG